MAQTDLGNGQVRILGAGLDVTPPAQTVPVGIPTIVRTSLQAPAGSLPPSVTVRADLTGPGLPGSLQLSTVPNGAFAIPAQSVRGTYVLSNIRLIDGETFVSYSAHRDATITVTDILIAQVTSRPLTYQEMIDKGIIVSSKNFRAYTFAFALEIESRLVEFEVPVIFPDFGPPVLSSIPKQVGTTPLPEGFSPPQVQPVQWTCADIAEDVARGLQYVKWQGPAVELPCGFSLNGDGGGDGEGGGGGGGGSPTILRSLLVIPGDVAFLNQFFSLTVLAQNGAPAGSNLRLENMTARVSLPSALRAAETNPPTNLSDPVLSRSRGKSARQRPIGRGGAGN